MVAAVNRAFQYADAGPRDQDWWRTEMFPVDASQEPYAL